MHGFVFHTEGTRRYQNSPSVARIVFFFFLSVQPKKRCIPEVWPRGLLILGELSSPGCLEKLLSPAAGGLQNKGSCVTLACSFQESPFTGALPFVSSVLPG